jgi:DHA1 family bicyclomycin/chloramphenicol resistance-like MFS transporter
VLYAGLCLYALGALGSALAPSFGVLIASRFVWGVGAAGPRALTLAIGRDIYDGDTLARILAVVASVFMVVPAIAPLLGQAVLSVGSWRWVMAAPIAVTLLLAAWLTRLPESLPADKRLFMGAVIFTGSRQVKKLGADRVIVTILPISVALSAGLAVWCWLADGRPTFLGWFALVAVINSMRTLINPLLQAQAMEPMGELAGTAAAAIGTITMGGGAVLASFVDRSIAGSVTPLAVAYAGYGAIGLGFALWARTHRPSPT